jgi:uncharacterized protein DUF1566
MFFLFRNDVRKPEIARTIISIIKMSAVKLLLGNTSMLLRRFHKQPRRLMSVATVLLILCSTIEAFGEGETDSSHSQGSPYVSPPYKAPPVKSYESRNRYVDNGDGTITDKNSLLMWAKADSYSDLGKCLDWNEANKYVSELQLGGYSDWDMPTVAELLSIYDDFEENAISYDHDPEYPLGLNKIFADGAAYLFWSKDTLDFGNSGCCAKSVYFFNGVVTRHRFDMCSKSGVRSIRRAH